MVRHIAQRFQKEEIEILKAQKEDISAMVDVWIAAFSPNLISRVSTELGERPDNAEKMREVLEKTWDNPHYWPWIARESATGRVVGLAFWVLDHLTEAPESTKPSSVMDHETLEVSFSWHQRPWSVRPRTIGTEEKRGFFDSFGRDMVAMQQRWLKGRTNNHLALLAVDPNTQGKGVGSRLIQVGLDRADRDGRVCSLEATPAGMLLYLRRGFMVVDSVTVDLSEWMGKGKGYGEYSTPMMLRLPYA